MTQQIKHRIEQIRRGEVPEGYKKTVAGIIPSEWELHLLSDHLQESRIPGSNGSMAKKLTVKLWNKGVVEKREIHEGSESTTYYSRKSGQLIYSKLDFLNCAFGIIPDHLDGYESTQDLPCFDIDGVNPYYLLTYMTQRSFYSHYGMIADGGRKARRVNPEDMLSFPLIYPSILEQEKIAKVLETQDRVIELYEEKIEQLKKLKKVFLQKLFPKLGASVPEWRFPEFTAPWEQRKLIEICEQVKDTVDPQLTPDKTFYEYSMPAFDDNSEPNIVSGYEMNSIRKVINVPCLLINKLNVRKRRIWLVEKPENNAVCSAEFVPVTSDISNLRFLKYVALKDDFSTYLEDCSSGSSNSQKRVTPDVIMKATIQIPTIDEQSNIGTFFTNIDSLITLHQRKCDEEKQKKKALMQLLLTGIVRVKT